MNENVEKILKANNQEEIINVIKNSDEDTRQKLINQVLKIDFNQIKDIYKSILEKESVNRENIVPITSKNQNRLSNAEKENYIKIGEEIVKNKKFAVVTMAGGQGTRLRT